MATFGCRAHESVAGADQRCSGQLYAGATYSGLLRAKAKGLDYSRLMVVSCQQPGQCDIRAANYVINAHLRRHDTYRSWFQYNGNGQIIRRTIQDPADIEFVPVHHGELTLPQIREIVQNTPDPLQWGCFRFGIVQGCDHFTFFASVDHVHVDAMIVGVTLMEFHLMYAALVGGHAPLELPPAGSYDDFCRRQHVQLHPHGGVAPGSRLDEVRRRY